ncbi:hypothetical protein CPB84DRAFT_708938 [Gymnopilus junonius]|uniref:Uncharacterized protein n=1 Tax=Gymnopilus junonius TaxID=109634 RepID=A0A9P5TPT3_GYMJU|nr:hypothetical protein CPB84DRAFT_708938 [Gymnopilus junonius]
MGTAASIAVPAEAAAAGAQVGLATPALTSSVGSLDSGSSSSGSGSSFSVGSGFASSPLKSQLGPTRSVNTEGKISKDSKEGQTENQTDTVSFSFWVFLCFSRMRLRLWGLIGSARAASSFPSISSPSMRNWDSLSLSLSSTWNRRNQSRTPQQTSSMTSSAPPSPSLSTSSPMKDAPNINVQTAVGVVLLGVAAAAVFWKVRPE